MHSAGGDEKSNSVRKDGTRNSRNGRISSRSAAGNARGGNPRQQRPWSSVASLESFPLASQVFSLSRDIAPRVNPPASYAALHCACQSCCGTHGAQSLHATVPCSAHPVYSSLQHTHTASSSSGSTGHVQSQAQYPVASYQPLANHSSSSPSFSSNSPLFAVREMSKPENNVAALNWRRLHLSRAKLKASSRTSALLSGFAMVAMVEINLPEGIPEPLLIAFCVCTTLLVSVHMLALMISTCILPNLEAVASIHGIVAVNESPHEKMHLYIEAAWGFSTVFGILLFMAEIAIICWVVFIKVSIKAALAGTIILIPVVMLFTAFALHFYRNLVAHKFERSAQTVQELEDMVNQLQGGTQHRMSGGSQVLHV